MMTTDKRALQTALLEWYTENKRDLPWRKTKNPYYIWVSEVMLQQTQVDTVIPYYERFITRFPTMHDLARAPEEEVLKAWEGLGYYSRARNLQQGVREVVEKYGARIPDDHEQLLKVKGVGPYTAGAIMSIAYNRAVPAVDGNVMRVAARLFRIAEDIAKAKTRRLIENVIAEYIPEDGASDFNQAVMELGALICKPKNPRCEVCPLAFCCRAKAAGEQELYPVKTRKAGKKSLHYAVAVVCDEMGRVLIRKRPDDGLLAGLWEFPMVLLESGENGAEQVSAYFEQTYGCRPSLTPTETTLTHVFSHLTWRLDVFLGRVGAEDVVLKSARDRLETKEDLKRYAFSAPHQKIRRLFLDQ